MQSPDAAETNGHAEATPRRRTRTPKMRTIAEVHGTAPLEDAPSQMSVDSKAPTYDIPAGSDAEGRKLGRARVYVGDCRSSLAALPERGKVGLIFADPPFNWKRDYDRWKDGALAPDPQKTIKAPKKYDTWDDAMPAEEYLAFTREWLGLCAQVLRPGGSFWVNIPDDWAAEIVVELKRLGLHMENWCIWHYRFGQNTKRRFINSKVHALHFIKPGALPVWNLMEVLEPSDRATTYFDPRTQSKKDGMPPGMRVPLDVWYGQYWGRIQGNNFERRPGHDNQLPEIYLERVIRATSNAGDLVLDPFLGSGTTGVMARALGREFIGLEFSKANAKSAAERIKLGPARPVGTGLNQSNAIFAPRKVGKKTRARLDGR
jgi:DNA modification methylase